MFLMDPDSKFMIITNTILDYVKLGLLLVLYSIPVITLGTAITAGMTVAMKIERGEAPVILQPFRKAFKENIRQALPITLLLEGIFAVLAFDWYQIMKMETGTLVRVTTAAIALAVLLLIMIGFYVFAGMARYELGFRALLKNATIYTILNFPKNLLGAVILAVGILLYAYLKTTVPIVICLIPALELFYMGKVCVQTFDRFENANKDLDNNKQEAC